MPVELDEYDISILKSLFDDARKSFRQISRETGITTPTVKARYERLVNVGFIKKIMPVIDFGKVEKAKTKFEFELQAENSSKNQFKNLKKGMQIMLNCDFCHGVIAGVPQIFKFANYERFFCCTSCKSEYKTKYAGRIQAIIEKNASNLEE
ncbi:MAG: AsnC family transcriptional regulator [Nitrososphaeraceae archaeon]